MTHILKPTLCLPRLLRLRDAPRYLGMDRHRFNHEVRPTLTEIRIGTQGIAFDRGELDGWVDDLIAQIKQHRGLSNVSNATKSQHPVKVERSIGMGTSVQGYSKRDIAKARARISTFQSRDD